MKKLGLSRTPFLHSNQLSKLALFEFSAVSAPKRDICVQKIGKTLKNAAHVFRSQFLKAFCNQVIKDRKKPEPLFSTNFFSSPTMYL